MYLRRVIYINRENDMVIMFIENVVQLQFGCPQKRISDYSLVIWKHNFLGDCFFFFCIL